MTETQQAAMQAALDAFQVATTSLAKESLHTFNPSQNDTVRQKVGMK